MAPLLFFAFFLLIASANGAAPGAPGPFPPVNVSSPTPPVPMPPTTPYPPPIRLITPPPPPPVKLPSPPPAVKLPPPPPSPPLPTPPVSPPKTTAGSLEGRGAMLDGGAVECFVGMLRRGEEFDTESIRESCVSVLYGLSHGGLRFKGLGKEAVADGLFRPVLGPVLTMLNSD
ncbi:hypothetical protein KY284_010985 [Solanum tuberosum]|nr:hypothetical protein KY284_010985 [Solanum tuberosum]